MLINVTVRSLIKTVFPSLTVGSYKPHLGPDGVTTAKLAMGENATIQAILVTMVINSAFGYSLQAHIVVI